MSEATVSVRAPRTTRALPRIAGMSLPTAILAALIVFGGIGIFLIARHSGFYYDEWKYIENRRGGEIGAYLDPHNGHLALLPVAIYKLLFVTVGLEHYWPYRVPVLIAHLAGVVLMYVLVRRRLGAWAALVPAVLLLFMSSSASNFLWAMQINQVGAATFGLAAFVFLDRPSRRNDIWASVMVALSIASAGMGLPVLLGVAVQVLMEPGRRRRWWIFAAPLALYLLWYVNFSANNDVEASNIGLTTQYVVDAAAAAAAAIPGLTPNYGAVLLVGGIAGVAILRRGSLPSVNVPLPSPRLAALLATALGFWGITALTRAQLNESGAPRYLQFGAIMLMLIAAEMLPRRFRWTPWLTGTVLVVMTALTIANLYHIRDAARWFRGLEQTFRPQLAAVEVAGGAAQQDMLIEPSVAATESTTAGQYLAAVRDIGSASGGLAWLQGTSQAFRIGADAELVRLEHVALSPVPVSARTPAGAPPEVVSSTGGTVTAEGACQRFEPSAAGALLQVRFAGGKALTITASTGDAVQVSAGRFADGEMVQLGSVPGGSASVVKTTPDAAPAVPWRIALGPSQPVRVCVTG